MICTRARTNVGFRGEVQLRGLVPGYPWEVCSELVYTVVNELLAIQGPTKVKACKSFLFTEGSIKFEIKMY